MKDLSVGPAGLFSTRRQRKLLDGLADRFRHCVDQQRRLHSAHDQQRAADDREFGHQRAATTASCRQQRREMLSQWDDAEEQLTSHYESNVVRSRLELSRLAAVFRQKAVEERKAVELKAQQRHYEVHQQYESCKNQPAVKKRQDLKRIDDALVTLQASLERVRDVTIRRLDGLPEVPSSALPEDAEQIPAVESVDQAVSSIEDLVGQCDDVFQDMHQGNAAKIVDSFLIPLGGIVLALLLAAIGYFVGPYLPYPERWLWMIAGILSAGILAFVVYLVLMIPLKRMTSQLYPKIVEVGQSADQFAAEGRKIASRNAAEASAELVQRRDSQLEAVRKWQAEQLAALTERIKQEQEDLRAKLKQSLVSADEEYTQDLTRVGGEMRAKADMLAHAITEQLASTDSDIEHQRQTREAARQSEQKRLSNRLKAGVRRGLDRISTTRQEVRERFADWDAVLAGQAKVEDKLDYLPLGFLCVGQSLADVLRPGDQEATNQGASAHDRDEGQVVDEPVRQSSSNETQQQTDQANDEGNTVDVDESFPKLFSEGEIPDEIPVVLHRRLHSGVIIQASPQHLDRAIELAHQILWRLLTGVQPSRAKLTLIDPLGRGQHFTSFMALADHDPSLVGHRVWTTDAKIDSRLGELAHHVEDVLQASLRDRFERIEDYNEVAGSMAEPYRAIAAVGFPEGLSREGYRHLRALFESGLRCGIFTVLVCDRTKPWPSDIPIPSGDKVLQLQIDDEGDWRVKSDQLGQLPFNPAMPPANALRASLVEKIGTAAVAASRVEIPLEQILASEHQARGCTDDGIKIRIGSQGANRSVSLQLGEGVKQHVLIAGKTGSGKSTLLHSIITSGAYHYTPDQLEFYLLDFKKGVEFKPYADSGLPHARVIGIESEREFGRSVLQRLDAELQARGEKFRAQGVQDLGDYRESTGESMPRIMLVVDEFQELFVRDDRLASDCTMLLDRLVRQGRSFGMHVVLSSQSLAGAYSLPRATLGQMAVRIAMQCSESDAALILADDNTAARLISRPGEAIYNDAGGLIEGNQPFQVAWLSSKVHREMLSSITARDEAFTRELPPPVVFEGNRPCRWTSTLADSAIAAAAKAVPCGLLGESVEIGPPVSVELARETGRNLLLLASSESRSAVLASVIAGICKSEPKTEIIYLDGTRADDPSPLTPWLSQAGIEANVVKVRDTEAEIIRLSQQIQQRSELESEEPPILVVVDPLERFRDLRQDESFNFSLDAADTSASGSVAFQNLLRDGPPANVFVIVVCGSVETLSRWLPRASQHDLELRVLGQMNATDSALLIDSPMASDLSAATMLIYDDSDGHITKFRQCDLPDAKAVKQWLS